jgi:ATP-dependent Clp protease ATP-binding subunit ClpX
MQKCHFCGKSQKEVFKLLEGIDGVHICDSCVDLSENLLRKEREKIDVDGQRRVVRKTFKIPAPSAIKQHLDIHVIGQDKAKKGIAVAAYNHYKRVINTSDIPIQKNNMLFLGPTGVGKTLIAQTVADYLNVPFIISDATSLTEQGYIGDDVEVLIHRLVQKADYDIAKAEVGIIYIDEIDKKAKRNDMVSLSRDVSGEGVQQSLLKLLEGSEVRVPNLPKRAPEQLTIKTDNILFVLSGAFVGMDDIVRERMGKTKIGFGEQKKEEFDWVNNVETKDLISYGLIPEFVGRLPSVNILHDLSRSDLIQVLTKPKFSVIKQYQSLFKIDGVDLEFRKDALEAIVDKCIKQKIGARGLRKILEESLLETQYELPEYTMKGITKVVITKETIDTQNSPWKIKEGGIA